MLTRILEFLQQDNRISEIGIKISFGNKGSSPKLESQNAKWHLLSKDTVGVLGNHLPGDLWLSGTFPEEDNAEHWLKGTWTL